MTITEKYERWLRLAVDDPELIPELRSYEGNEKEIYERFYCDLAFGTGGLRGILGAGTNRMNVYVVRRATQGLANYLHHAGLPLRAAISYDTRIKSDLFARESARVLAANGIQVFLYPRHEPTPALSWAVRYYGCGAGICVTASHNPAEYNGYKVYGPDGCQITTEAAEAILNEIFALDTFDDVTVSPFEDAVENGAIRFCGEDCLEAFLDAVEACRLAPGEKTELKVVYTPLCGTGLECVTKMFRRMGIREVYVVPEQEKPDGHFPTCPYPNPEIREAMQKGLELCDRVHPDLLIGTDPDCDRMGAAVPAGDGYRLISGNEMGVLLFDYICRKRSENGTMPEKPVAITTIVSTDMVDAVAKEYGVELRRMLTGFKYIGEQIGFLEAAGEKERYLFGFEESYGYLSGSHVRDKDAVNAAMLCCEMAADYRKKGMTPGDAIDALYAKHGYYRNALHSFTFKGSDGMKAMAAVMADLRANPITTLCGAPVTESADYGPGYHGLPKSDVLTFRSEKGKVIIRPSGTEPKLKLYFSASAPTAAEADALCAEMDSELSPRIQ